MLQKSEGELPPADAKPEYHNVVATVTSIDADQTPLYYDAAPDTGRKASPPPPTGHTGVHAVAARSR